MSNENARFSQRIQIRILGVITVLIITCSLIAPSQDEMLFEPGNITSGLVQSQALIKQSAIADTAIKVNFNPTDVSGQINLINLPQSLQGTQIHGDLKVDDDGNLIIDHDIKKLFTYFLNTQGELTREEIVQKMKKGIQDYLAQTAERQALKILDDYMAYVDALAERESEGLFTIEAGNFERFSQALETRSQIRREYLGEAVADAFFLEEELYDNYTLKRLELQNDTSLSTEEKIAQLKRYEEDLPEVYRAVRQKHDKRLVVTEKVNALKDSNASLDEMHYVWTKAYGDEAADRLLAVEQKRRVWQSRYNSYVAARDELNLGSLNGEEFREQLLELQQDRFTADELRRVKALDRIGNSEFL